MSQQPVPECPDTCPECGTDLRSDGYPIGHQDPDGEQCPFAWVSIADLFGQYDED